MSFSRSEACPASFARCLKTTSRERLNQVCAARVRGDAGDRGPSVPYRLLDHGGAVVEPVQAFFAELQAGDKAAATIRSYGMDLLRWWRFLRAWGIEWNHATRSDARDFTRRMKLADKPQRLHWRHRKAGYTADSAPEPKASRKRIPGVPNAITGKVLPGPKFSATTRAHCETVLRTFYDFHLNEGADPIINPFPLDRSRRGNRANAHHTPGRPFQRERAGRYRPTIPHRAPRRIPDELFNALFAVLKHNRDRALLAFWVSMGARAEELLTSRHRDALPGQQLLGVIRKGTRAYQQLPCSTDALVWLRLYQEEMRRDGVPAGRNLPLWWTLRRPWRPLNYDAVPGDVQPGQRPARLELVAPAHGVLPTRARSQHALEGRPVGLGPRSPDHDSALPARQPGRGHRACPRSPCPPDTAAREAAGAAGSRPQPRLVEGPFRELVVTTTQTLGSQAAIRPAQTLAGEAFRSAKERFPPRPYEDAWPATNQSFDEVMARLNGPPLRAASASTHDYRQRGARYILNWLQDQLGETWQQRWDASPAASSTRAQWNELSAGWTGYQAVNAGQILNSGLFALVCVDVIRPSLRWQLTRTSTNLRAIITKHRDPEGFVRLQELVGPEPWASHLGILAKNVLVKLVIAKGGGLADITVGDALEFLDASRGIRTTSYGQSLFYSWLKQLGHLPADASRSLVRNFWTQIEHIRPGIDTLRLPPDVVTAWKQASGTRVVRRRLPDGSIQETVTDRANCGNLMLAVRAFYLDPTGPSRSPDGGALGRPLSGE
ncbi:site-specific integrase [Streptomyces sp. NPDC093221]|uniref:site-specific integrase n=1 Tax=Streptomyces sp. NPDC093221 TaxID=3366032 RepID=UPI00380AEFD5